jgi:amino acid transporter
MSARPDPAVENEPTQRLRPGAVTTGGMLFMAVAATAPLTALSSNVSLSVALGSGGATVGFLLGVGALMALFAVGYIVLTRYVTEAGAYAAFVEFGLGRSAGAAIAFIAVLAYNLAATGMIVATGYFAALTVEDAIPLQLPWFAWSALALAVITFLGVRGVEIAQRVTTVISLAQFAIIAVLGIAVLTQRPQGWAAAASTVVPTDLLSTGATLTIVFCLVSFGGFEATAVYGEEAAAPRRSIRNATYLGLAMLVSVFALSTWSLVAAYDDPIAAAAQDPGSLVGRTAALFLGAWSGPVLNALVTVSFLAAGVAFHSMACRYMFSLGRSGLLPRGLARTHPRHGTPYRGSAVQVAVTILVILPFALTGGDPLATMFPAFSGITSLALVIMMFGCCASLVVASLRGRVVEGWWQTILAPSAAGLGMLGCISLIVANYSGITGSDSPIVAAAPAVLVLVAGYGALRRRRLDTRSRSEARPLLLTRPGRP